MDIADVGAEHRERQRLAGAAPDRRGREGANGGVGVEGVAAAMVVRRASQGEDGSIVCEEVVGSSSSVSGGVTLWCGEVLWNRGRRRRGGWELMAELDGWGMRGVSSLLRIVSSRERAAEHGGRCSRLNGSEGSSERALRMIR